MFGNKVGENFGHTIDTCQVDGCWSVNFTGSPSLIDLGVGVLTLQVLPLSVVPEACYVSPKLHSITLL